MKTVQSILWSLRWNVARGWRWNNERHVTEQTGAAWLEQFQKDEPNVTFVVAARMPKVPQGLSAPREHRVAL